MDNMNQPKKGGLHWIVVLIIGFILEIMFSPSRDKQSAVYRSAVTPQSVPREVEKTPVHVPAVPLVLSFNGRGEQSTDIFQLNPGLVQASFTHDNTGNFIIWLINGLGEKKELIVNSYGSTTDASKAFGISQGGDYILSVTADGNWNIELK